MELAEKAGGSLEVPKPVPRLWAVPGGGSKTADWSRLGDLLSGKASARHGTW